MYSKAAPAWGQSKRSGAGDRYAKKSEITTGNQKPIVNPFSVKKRNDKQTQSQSQRPRKRRYG